MLTKGEIIDYLKKHYPYENSEVLSEILGLSLSAIRTIATRNGIHKSDAYLKILHKELMIKKEDKYLASIPKITLNQLERNIIIGSILGDGSLTFAKRSRNAYYREHFSIKQQEYRIWKMHNIHSLKFRIEKECHLKSPSHPVFTELYYQFYIKGIKTITEANIKLLDHPIGLACLYMDDGSLVITASKYSNKIYIFPRLSIYTLSFTKEENQILIEHIKRTYGIDFKLTKGQDGSNYYIELNKRYEIINFINLVEPFIKGIPSMIYKIDIQNRLKVKKEELSLVNIKHEIIIAPLDVSNRNYTNSEENLIKHMKLNGYKDINIANYLNRSYYGVVDKIRRLRRSGKL